MLGETPAFSPFWASFLGKKLCWDMGPYLRRHVVAEWRRRAAVTGKSAAHFKGAPSFFCWE